LDVASNDLNKYLFFEGGDLRQEWVEEIITPFFDQTQVSHAHPGYLLWYWNTLPWLDMQT
jgi:hypothetical protein